MTSPEDMLAARSELLAVLSNLYSQTWDIYMLRSNIGICTHVEDELSDEAYRLWRTIRPDLFKSWRYYSGDADYPVPGPAGHHPGDYYCFGSDLWTGRQRMLRRDLLRHIMAEL